jgi:hypothetical protein
MPSSVINSDDGVISGTSGLKSSGGDDGSLKIQTNGTDAASVTSGQVVSFVNNFGTVANLPAYQCRAWVNFNGDPVAIRASGNVSSITDNGTGHYTVNFTTAMPDANYSPITTIKPFSGASSTNGKVANIRYNTNLATGSFAVFCNSTGGAEDFDIVSVAVFR